VILNVFRESGEGMLKIEFSKTDDGKDTFNFSIDRERLRTVGFEGLSKFLAKLHTLKSIGDFEGAEKFFAYYSQVDETMLKVRDIIIANKIPRRLELQPNLHLMNGIPEYKGYPESFEGIIQSYCERFERTEMGSLRKTWAEDFQKFKHM